MEGWRGKWGEVSMHDSEIGWKGLILRMGGGAVAGRVSEVTYESSCIGRLLTSPFNTLVVKVFEFLISFLIRNFQNWEQLPSGSHPQIMSNLHIPTPKPSSFQLAIIFSSLLMEFVIICHYFPFQINQIYIEMKTHNNNK